MFRPSVGDPSQFQMRSLDSGQVQMVQTMEFPQRTMVQMPKTRNRMSGMKAREP